MAYLGKLVKCNQTKRAICKAIRIGGVEFHDIVRQFETCHQGHEEDLNLQDCVMLKFDEIN